MKRCNILIYWDSNKYQTINETIGAVEDLERCIPAALWTGPFLRYLLVVGCSHDWDHKWPDDREDELSHH